jgi:hypothetical protein
MNGPKRAINLRHLRYRTMTPTPTVAIRLERVTVRTYRIRTSRFAAKRAASSIDERPRAVRSMAMSRFATGLQRRASGGSAAK